MKTYVIYGVLHKSANRITFIESLIMTFPSLCTEGRTHGPNSLYPSLQGGWEWSYEFISLCTVGRTHDPNSLYPSLQGGGHGLMSLYPSVQWGEHMVLTVSSLCTNWRKHGPISFCPFVQRPHHFAQQHLFLLQKSLYPFNFGEIKSISFVFESKSLSILQTKVPNSYLYVSPTPYNISNLTNNHSNSFYISYYTYIILVILICI